MTAMELNMPSTNRIKSVTRPGDGSSLIPCLLPSSSANDAVVRRQWTLKGIPPEAVDETREAARRSGMKLNSWVTQALIKAIDDARDGEPEEAVPATTQEDRTAELERYIKESLSDLRKRTEEIENSMKTINAFLVKMYSER